jgi:beta-galactosidase
VRLRQLVLCLICCLMTMVSSCAMAETAHRTTLSLNGTWDVEDSVGANEMPKTYNHTAPVPGLTHSAVPAFADVDQYKTKQLLSNLVAQGRYSRADFDRLGDVRGISYQKRNYFWYRKMFDGPTRNAVALLKVNKSQFGTIVYLNGVRIGEHDACFTAAYFDVTRAIHWNAPNELVIRIGAHPGVLPPNVSQGTDFEKNRWTPGIYDDVSLEVMNNPVIANVQVAPQLATSSILVQTELHNYSDHALTTNVEQHVFTWKTHTIASERIVSRVEVPAGATKLVKQTVPVPKAHLWSSEDPFLYQVNTRTSGDDVTTRFGMREVPFRHGDATRLSKWSAVFLAGIKHHAAPFL